jgi:hypothetical protein
MTPGSFGAFSSSLDSHLRTPNSRLSTMAKLPNDGINPVIAALGSFSFTLNSLLVTQRSQPLQYLLYDDPAAAQ